MQQITSMGTEPAAGQTRRPTRGGWRAALGLGIVIAMAWFLTPGSQAQTPAHHLKLYDGASGTGWTNRWSAAFWAPDGYDPAHDPLHSFNEAAPAPGRPGVAIELTLGEPPDRPWAFTPVSTGPRGFYLNQIKTLEFDLYFEPDCTDAEALWFIFNDAGHANLQPRLVDLIPGWSTMTAAQRYARWHHVSIDLASLNPHDPDVSRLVIYHLGLGLAHMAITDITLGWDDDVTPPQLTGITPMFDPATGELTLHFNTDEMTIYRVEYGVGDLTRHVQGDYHAWDRSHTAVLTGLVPGVANPYRILLRDHQLDPAVEGNLATFTGSYDVPPDAPAPPPTPAPATPQRYLAIHDSGITGGWANGWVPGFWAPDNYDPANDPSHSFNAAAVAPGHAGKAIELTLGEPPDRPWALTPLNQGNLGFFLDEVRTLEFDVYFPDDAADPESLWVLLNDAGRADEPLLVDLIPGWFTMTRSQRYGHWFHVSLDLAGLHPLDFAINRLVFYHYGDAPVHFYLADVRFGIVDRTTPPVIALTGSSLSLDYRQLALQFTTDEATLYRVEYGTTAYDRTVSGGASDWSTSHTATLTGLLPGTTYRYRIVAWDHHLDPQAPANPGVYSGVVTIPPEPTLPPNISGLRATDATGSRATLVWTNDRPCTATITYSRPGGEPLSRTFADYALNRSSVLDLLEPSTAYTATVMITDAFSLSRTQSVAFVTGPASPPTVTITVDPTRTHPISPWIYGINFYQQIADAPPNLTLNRAGGNRWTAYNWENNASNAGLDWYYQSDDYLSPSNTPGEAVRSLIAADRARGNASLMTVALQGYVAADKNGPVDLNDPNHIAQRFRQVGYQKGSAFSATPSLADASVYQDEFLWALRGMFPGDIFADPATPTFVSLDNEPDLWFSTHKEIQPAPMPPADFMQRTVALARSLKSLDPAIQVFGPANYGLYGMTTFQGAAGYDLDHWFVDAYLQTLRNASTTAGRRLLDVYDFHWYSEARVGNTSVLSLTGPNLTPDQIQAIVQSPRSLWDTNYTENSWIVDYLGGPIAILARLQSRIDAIWPGTKLAVTEYDNGGDNHIAGAIAQADNLGIFGSQGLFAATFWPMSSRYPFILGAFRMYRDYDGTNASFGDISLAATSSATTNVAAYVSQDSQRPGRHVIVALNRSFASQDVRFNGLTASGTARVFRMEGTNPRPVFVGQVPAQLPAWVVTLPPLSISTIELNSDAPKTPTTVNTWPTAAGLTYGSPLAAATLTGGSASTPGTFAWTDGTLTPPAGSFVGRVTFTPANPALFDAVTGTVRVAVAPKPLTPAVTLNNRVYDGTTTATTIATRSLGGVVGADAVSLGLSGTVAAFPSKRAGDYPDLLVLSLALSGAKAANYTLATNRVHAGATITPKPIAPGATLKNRVYDGTTTPPAISTRTLTGVVGSDSVSLGSSGTVAPFPARSAGFYPALNVTGLALSGSAASNYFLTTVTTTASASIIPKSITPTVTLNSRVYDGTTRPTTIASRKLTGGVAGDDVNLGDSGLVGGYPNPNLGTYSGLVITALSLGGADAPNYTLSTNQVTAIARITARPLAIQANPAVKPGGVTLTFAGTEFTTSGLVGIDGAGVTRVSLTSTGAKASAPPGTYDILPRAAVGNGLTNYALTYVSGTLTVTPPTAGTQTLPSP